MTLPTLASSSIALTRLLWIVSPCPASIQDQESDINRVNNTYLFSWLSSALQSRFCFWFFFPFPFLLLCEFLFGLWFRCP